MVHPSYVYGLKEGQEPYNPTGGTEALMKLIENYYGNDDETGAAVNAAKLCYFILRRFVGVHFLHGRFRVVHHGGQGYDGLL